MSSSKSSDTMRPVPVAGVPPARSPVPAIPHAGNDAAHLSEIEARYRMLFESIDEAFCIIEVLFEKGGTKGVDYRFIEVNPAFERHTGLKDAVGHTAREIVPQLDEFWYQTYGRIALTGEPARFENRAEALGRDYDVYAFRVGESHEYKVAILFNDITVRKRHEETLLRNAERQSFLLKLSDALRPLGDSLETRETACRVLGQHLAADRVLYSEISTDGKTVLIPHGYVREGMPPLLGRLMAADYDLSVATLRSGEPLILTNTALLPEKEAEAFRAISIAATITIPLVKEGRWVANLSVQHCTPREWSAEEIELIQETAERTWAAVVRSTAEQAMSVSEEKYRTLFESIDEGVMTLELITNEQGDVVDYIHQDANPALERHSSFGFEIIGKRVSEIYPELPEIWFERFGRVMRTGESERFEEQGAHRAWFEVYASRIGGPGSNRVVCVYSNITARKHREAHLALLAEVHSRFPSSGLWQDLLPPICRSILGHFHFAALKLIEFPATHGPVTLIYDSRDESQEAGTPVACRLDEYFSLAQGARLRAGEVLAIDDTTVGGLPGGGAAFQEHGPCSILSAPYLAEGGLRFLIAGIRKGTAPWRQEEMDLLRELASHIYLRVERSRADAALREAHAQLETRVRERTSELENTLALLRTEVIRREQIEGERMELLKRQMRGQEDERLRISHDLHDNLGQHMVAVMLALGELDQKAPPDVFQQNVRTLRADLDAFVQSVRRQAWELRPAELEHLGLEHALRYYVNDWSLRTGIDVAFRCEEGEPPGLTSEAMVALYRVTQEALTNIHRHAGATSVVISLVFNPSTRLTIEDDGVGFKVEHGTGRLGLVGMNERLMIVRGTLGIESAPGCGARVIATLPRES